MLTTSTEAPKTRAETLAGADIATIVREHLEAIDRDVWDDVTIAWTDGHVELSGSIESADLCEIAEMLIEDRLELPVLDRLTIAEPAH